MKAELIYITDAYCIWCHGFGKAVNQLVDEYANSVSVRVVNGGMIPSDLSLFDMFSRFPDPMALHQQVTQTSGQEFGKAYLAEIKNYRSSKRILNSSVPARAMVALKMLGVTDELALASAIQRTYYVTGSDLQCIASYQSIASQFGIDFDAFKRAFNAPAAALGVAEDRQLVEQLGIQGFPALLLRADENRYAQIARGYMPFGGLKANLDAALAQLFPAEPALEGMTCGLDGEGC